MIVLHIEYGPPLERAGRLLHQLAQQSSPSLQCLPVLRVCADESEGWVTGALEAATFDFDTGGLVLRMLDVPDNRAYFEATGFTASQTVDLSLWCIDEGIEFHGWIGTLTESELEAADEREQVQDAIAEAARALKGHRTNHNQGS